MSWKEELRQSIRSSEALLARCGLDAQELPIAASSSFPVLVSPRWLALMEQANPQDPLLLQVLAREEEIRHETMGSSDPVSEQAAQVVKGLLHKYPHRVLLMTGGACPIHCRYCFRRHFPYESQAWSEEGWQDILQYLRQHEIQEVILSGGDPLMLSDARLERIFKDVSALSHVRRIRIHTRVPTTLPSRFTEDFWAILHRYRERLIWVWHINHAKELDEEIATLVQRCLADGMRVLSQTVLLQGVNDTLPSLKSLMWALDASGIQPYYIHQFDRVQGAMHFEVEVSKSLALMESLRACMPGYLVPKLVQEIPHRQSKTPLI